MSHNLENLFTGNFLIHSGYAASLVPSLVKAFMDKTPVDAAKLEQELTAKAVVKMAATGGETAETASNVIVLGIKQPIAKYSNYSGLGSKSFMRILESLKNDESIAGVVLDIDSGGGQVYGTGDFYDYIAAYPKPIVTYTDGYLCSAAYYIGNAAKYIIANRRADAIGSIGAYAQWVDFNGVWEKLGGKIHTVYSSLSPDKNKENRAITESGDYKPYVKNVLDPIVETFHADMKATRGGLHKDVFGGDTWNGEKALEMGLVDELGTLQTAIDKVFELSANQKSNNQNSNNMSKQRVTLQAALALGTIALAENDGGSFLNTQQLDDLEANLTEKDGQIATLTTDLATANTAKTDAEAALATANTNHTTALTDHETAVNAILTNAGLEATGTLTEKIAAIAAHQATLDQKDGAKHTNVQTDGKEAGAAAPAYVDASAGHNQIANSLFK